MPHLLPPMSDSDLEFAETLKSEHKVLSDVSVGRIVTQIRSLRASGVADKRIQTLIPKLFRIKDTVDEKADEYTALDPREIRIESLPEELDRDDWS